MLPPASTKPGVIARRRNSAEAIASKAGRPLRQRTARSDMIALVIIILASMAFSIYAATLPEGPLMLRFFNRDDAFYYFKVAQNISEGYGITFDRLAPTNGFHPLWLVICIPFFALARLDLILPFRLLLVLLGILNAGTILLVFRSLRQAVSARAGLVGASVWAFSYPLQVLVSRMGLETGLTAFSIILLVYVSIRAEQEPQWDFKRYLGFSLAAILVLLSRLDNIFLVIFFGIWLVFRKTNLRNLLINDLVASALAVVLAFYLRLGMLGEDAYTIAFRPAAFSMVILAAILHPLVNLFFGLYRQFPVSSNKRLSFLARLALSTLAGSIAVAVIMVALQAMDYIPAFSRTIPFFEFVLCSLLTLAGRGILQLASRGDAGAEQKFSFASWKTHIAKGFAYFGPLALVLAAYMLLNKLYAGTPMPVSGQIKQWWATLIYTVYGRAPTTLAAFFDQFIDTWPPLSHFIYRPVTESLAANGSSIWLAIAPAIIFAGFLAVMIALGKRKSPAGMTIGVLVPLLAGSLIQFIYYDASGYVASKEWYWVSQAVFLALLSGSAAELLIRNARYDRWRAIIQAAIGIACVVLFAHFARSYARSITFPAAIANPYREEAAFVEENTEPGSLVGMTGGGTVAYFIKDRTVINLDGLINSSGYFTALKENRAATYLDFVELDYVYGNEYMLIESIPYAYMFQGRIELKERAPTGSLYRYHPASP